jgi:hypothetical protein
MEIPGDKPWNVSPDEVHPTDLKLARARQRKALSLNDSRQVHLI